MKLKRYFVAFVAILVIGIVNANAIARWIEPWIERAYSLSGISENTLEYDAEPPTSINTDGIDYRLRVHFLDVGNADAILVEFDGSFALIDAGGGPTADFVVGYLERHGVKELRYVVATHPHADHIGGMSAVLDRFDVGTLLMPDATHTTRTFERFLNAIERNDVSVVVPGVGDVFYLGYAHMMVLSPAREYVELNDMSIVIRLEYGQTSFLLTGDTTRIAEEDMVSAGLPLRSDVLKVAHHGSHTSSSYLFLREVMPKYAVITVGADNQYGHPHNVVMSRLSDLSRTHGTQVFRSDLHGTIVFASNGLELSVTTEF